jgi:hypothetical protein
LGDEDDLGVLVFPSSVLEVDLADSFGAVVGAKVVLTRDCAAITSRWTVVASRLYIFAAYPTSALVGTTTTAGVLEVVNDGVAVWYPGVGLEIALELGAIADDDEGDTELLIVAIE